MKKLLGYQREDVDEIKRNKLRALIASAPGTGKAQPTTALVLTPTGWATIGSLVPGDVIVDPDGGTAEVIGVFPQGEKGIFEITFNDGSKAECCSEHLWLVRDRNGRNDSKGGWKIVELGHIMKNGIKADGQSHRWSIPLSKAVEYDLALTQPLPLMPYTLGALLGDGGLTGDLPRFSTIDNEILDRIKRELGSELTLVKKTAVDYNIVNTHNFKHKTKKENSLKRILASIGLMGKHSHDKFIPSCYLTASVQDRIELLRGLMDTDGTVNKGLASYCSVSQQLAQDVVTLVQSLGGSCTLTTRTTKYTYKGVKKNG